MRLCILCLLLIASLFSCAQAVITDFISPSTLSFSKPSDIVRAFSLYASQATKEDKINNPPYLSTSNSFYYHTYGDFITSSIQGLDANDIFSGQGLGQTLMNLHENSHSRAKVVNSVLLQYLPSIYQISDTSSTKYDSALTDILNLNFAFSILRMQSNNAIDTINLFNNNVPYGSPNLSKYLSAMSGYGEVKSSIAYLISKIDHSMDAIHAIHSNISQMKSVAQSLADGTIDEATYVSSMTSLCLDINNKSYDVYTTLYFYSKTSATQL